MGMFNSKPNSFQQCIFFNVICNTLNDINSYIASKLFIVFERIE